MTDPTITVAQDLTAIVDLHADLEDQALHHADDPQMPGGDAMVCLAAVASLEAWQNLLEHAEDEAGYGRREWPEVYEDDWEPPLQTLLFWTEQARVERDEATDLKPTIQREAGYLRQILGWLAEAEPHFDDLARDVAAARRRLEGLLRAGQPAETGIPCIHADCGGARLRRRIVPCGDRHAAERQPDLPEGLCSDDDSEAARIALSASWVYTDWYCPNHPDEHRWDDDRYRALVVSASEATRYARIGSEEWGAMTYAVREVGCGYRTLQTWVNRGLVRRVCIVAGRRTFVSLDDARSRRAA